MINPLSRPLFDSHLHIIDPHFPLQENQGYLPPAFTVRDYFIATENLQVIGGAVVSGSFQAFDQSYLVDALAQLGPGFVGVTQLPVTVTDEELLYLHDRGVRAVRFNLKRGGSEKPEHILAMAQRIFDLHGWHVEFYVDSRDLEELKPILLKLPKYSIDHVGLSYQGLLDLFDLVERGAYVKATGFGRLDFDPVPAIRKLLSLNPDSVFFGTDLPSTRAPKPFSVHDIDLLVENFPPNLLNRLFFENGASFYKVKK